MEYFGVHMISLFTENKDVFMILLVSLFVASLSQHSPLRYYYKQSMSKVQ